jgi:hypothetical protein
LSLLVAVQDRELTQLRRNLKDMQKVMGVGRTRSTTAATSKAQRPLP